MLYIFVCWRKFVWDLEDRPPDLWDQMNVQEKN